LGCEAVTEFNVATKEDPKNDKFHVIEESSCLCRFCLRNLHPFKMTMTEGGQPGGRPVAHYERPCACPIVGCKMCCYQSIEVTDGQTNLPIGSVREGCFFCIPEFSVRNEAGAINYYIHVPVCCGCLPNICAEGCCRVPFYIYAPTERNKEIGKIIKNWGSLGTELMGMHQFQCEFPANATPQQKAVLMGATYLLNELFFKRDGCNN
jgi:hypothetical protein